MESIGKKIAFYRKARGMTQEELSVKLTFPIYLDYFGRPAS